MDLKIKIHRKSNQINKKNWNEIVNFMFLKTDFLEIIENLELGKDVYYFEIYDNDDLVGVFVAYPQFKSLYHNLEETIYGKFSFILKKFFKLSPSLLCNFPYSPFHQMFAIKDTKNKGEIFSFFLINLKKIAFENSYKTCGVLSIRNEILLEESKKNNFIQVFSGFNLYYDINWNSFDDFKKSFPRSKRYMINREKKQFESSGNKFEIVKKENLDFEKISELFKNNFKKYNMPIEDKISSEFIKAFEKKDEMNFFIIKNSLNEIIASILVFYDNKTLIGFRIGQNENNSDFSFFNLAIYKALEFAIENKLERYELGTGSYKYKILRGAKYENSYNIIIHKSSFMNLILKELLKIYSKYNFNKHSKRINIVTHKSLSNKKDF